MSEKFIILTEGHTNPHTAKTCSCMIRYRPDDVVAMLDSTQAGKTSADLLKVGNAPVVTSLADAPDANTLLIGIAPPGGKIPPAWREVVLEAISRKMNIVSGLHDFFSEDEQFATASKEHGTTITDIRKNNEHDIARRNDLRKDCFRLHTIGHDCSIGKMVTSKELSEGLKRKGHDAKFIATGQTGILIEGDGCPIDCVTADFVSGAVEKLIKKYQHHDILVIEGQGSLVHPSYSGVTLSLLHGCLPHALILCFEVGRETVTGIDHLKIPPLVEIRQMCEVMASPFQSCPVIGVSMNSSKVSAEEAESERKRVGDELQLPVCDVIRDGPDALLEVIVDYKNNVDWLS